MAGLREMASVGCPCGFVEVLESVLLDLREVELLIVFLSFRCTFKASSSKKIVFEETAGSVVRES